MAKVIKNGEPVECEVLNENAGQYIVKFKTGVVRGINKNRVYDLDRIDEGVLDTIRNAANKYGRKVVSAVKSVTEKVKNFVVRAFKLENFVFFQSEGVILGASHPINAIEGAKNSNCVNFVPGDGVIETCDEIGIKPEAVENFTYDSEYDGAMQFDEMVSESAIGSKSLLQAIFEGDADNKRLSKSEKISLHGTFCDKSSEQLINYIGNEYMSRYKGNNPNSLPLLIWGAPGIGKTSIMRSIRDNVKGEIGQALSIISVNGGNIGPDDFTMPATIVRTFTTNKFGEENREGFKGSTSTLIKDLPKTWLPVYNPNSEEADPILLNAIANGGGLRKDEDGNEYIENGPGGIFFIDEFSRMTDDGMNALMQTPTTREIGSNSTLRFGDRWVIICAANRKSDMSRKGGSEALAFEAASKTRFNHVNFVPAPKDWIAWANKPSNRRKGRKNVLPEIISYIESEVKNNPSDYGDFYEMWIHPDGELNGEKGTANPRTWEALSETLIDQVFENTFGEHYDSITEMPKRVLIEQAAGIVGRDVAKRFADFVSQFSLFTSKDAENVWEKGNSCQYAILARKTLNSANIEEYFTNHIFPMMKDNYPGGFDGKVAPDAALNFMKFLEACCYDDQKQFMLNRFKTISSAFGIDFGVDLRSIKGPYAEAANYKEDVVAKNEIV